jgi:hypothetical protein
VPVLPVKAAPAVLKEKLQQQRKAELAAVRSRVQQLLADMGEQTSGQGVFDDPEEEEGQQQAQPAAQPEDDRPPGVDMDVFGEDAPVAPGQPDQGEGIPSPTDQGEGIPSPTEQVVAAAAPQVLIWRQHFEYQGTFDERYALMVSKLLEGALRLDHDSVTEIWAEDGRLIGHRWNLLNARIAQPRVDPGKIADVDHTGPWRLHLLHGVPLERLGGVSRTTCLLGFSPEVGGAGENMVYFRGFAGMLSRARLAKKAIDVARSSKAPEGVLLEATGYVNVASVKYGGHEREAAIVRRGLATHAPRAQQWVLHPDDAQLTGIYLVR